MEVIPSASPELSFEVKSLPSATGMIFTFKEGLSAKANNRGKILGLGVDTNVIVSVIVVTLEPDPELPPDPDVVELFEQEKSPITKVNKKNVLKMLF
jgi:hypothetical protein